MKKTRLLFLFVSMVLVIAVASGADYLSELTGYRRAIAEIKVSEIDLSAVPDGVYTGEKDAVWVAATVTVTVENHRIIGIELDHRHSQGTAANVIPDRVIEAQSLQVDIVSGATSSSMVILKAIDMALSGVSQ